MIERVSLFQLERIGAGKNVLLGVFWGMATNAEQYDKVTWNIHRARSTSPNPHDPRFEVLFEIKDDSTIGLLWIQEIDGIGEIDERDE